MKRLAKSQSQLDVLDRLNNFLIPPAQYYPSKVWGFLSIPNSIHDFTQGRGKSKVAYRESFNTLEVDDLIDLKQRLVESLLKKNKYRCCYCKRSVGKHGWSWEIEHVKSKKHHPHLTFDMDNLTLACIDCNRFKNINIDNKNLSDEIINPNSLNFDYDSHLNFFQLSTARLHFLKYTPISSSGNRTYKGLCFDKLEYQEIVKSISEEKCNAINRIDAAIEYFNSNLNANSKNVANFLIKLKLKMLK